MFLVRNEDDRMMVLPLAKLYYLWVVARLDDDAARRETESTQRRSVQYIGRGIRMKNNDDGQCVP